MNTSTIVKGAVVIGAVGLGAYVLIKALSVGKGILTGDNALTQNAKDADGNKVDAYIGVPVVGTLGAAANEVSGGYLASFGGWIGRSIYDLTHSDYDSEPPKASYDETDRLLARYPGPVTNEPSGIFGGWSDQAGIY